jgi:glyoxylase-like metal-dependent hydrolase (beta-lactamase superfamily II)
MQDRSDDNSNLPDFAFYIKNNKTGDQLIFDLGTRADWWNSVPAIADLCENHVPGLRVEKNVTEILEEGGVKLSDLKAMILSHWHFDHCMSSTNPLEPEC